MPSWIENLKTLLPLLTLVAVGAGFYYTTNHRLDHLEEVVGKLKDQVSQIEKSNHLLKIDLDKSREEIVRLRKTVSKKQDKRK
jgi:chromosome segregation ATPase